MDIDELTKSPSSGIIETWLVSHLAEMLGINRSEIDRRQPFASFGLDSAQTVSLIGDLEAWLGRSLSPTLAWEFPTIKALAEHLAGEATTPTPVYTIDTPRRLHSEPIAIIGLGCRFPGAGDPEAFWRLLRDGVEAITEVPRDRWDVNAFYDLNPTTPGKMNTRWGGFLEQVDLFDPHFFGISPREAASMDPQQRLVLEVSWEALENAGQTAEELADSQTGVFIGISTNDYSRRQLGDPVVNDAYAGTGNALSIAANRVSYLLDLRGPSLAVDTACSSSLVAVHYACQSLRNGECSLALAGGVNLILSPELTVTFSQARMMASDGRCKT
ncbi:MAG TPA: type I polyketide synthase, partial [Dehalococcoidia bacterium]|nr:type I polyketide synthase [Dehalococcoidia bacterium]